MYNNTRGTSQPSQLISTQEMIESHLTVLSSNPTDDNARFFFMGLNSQLNTIRDVVLNSNDRDEIQKMGTTFIRALNYLKPDIVTPYIYVRFLEIKQNIVEAIYSSSVTTAASRSNVTSTANTHYAISTQHRPQSSQATTPPSPSYTIKKQSTNSMATASSQQDNDLDPYIRVISRYIQKNLGADKSKRDIKFFFDSVSKDLPAIDRHVKNSGNITNLLDIFDCFEEIVKYRKEDPTVVDRKILGDIAVLRLTTRAQIKSLLPLQSSITSSLSQRIANLRLNDNEINVTTQNNISTTDTTTNAQIASSTVQASGLQAASNIDQTLSVQLASIASTTNDNEQDVDVQIRKYYDVFTTFYYKYLDRKIYTPTSNVEKQELIQFYNTIQRETDNIIKLIDRSTNPLVADLIYTAATRIVGRIVGEEKDIVIKAEQLRRAAHDHLIKLRSRQ